MARTKKINVASILNPWMDVTFTVLAEDFSAACNILKESWQKFIAGDDCEDVCYGDILETALRCNRIEFSAVYANCDEFDEECLNETPAADYYVN